MTVSGGSAADTGPDGQAVYTALGWDFGGVWQMGGEGYPVLRWEN
jgi:hypothetical protein